MAFERNGDVVTKLFPRDAAVRTYCRECTLKLIGWDAEHHEGCSASKPSITLGSVPKIRASMSRKVVAEKPNGSRPSMMSFNARSQRTKASYRSGSRSALA